jgi:DNA-binding NtrC family response regulator
LSEVQLSSSEAGPRDPRGVLIVDDEEMIRDMLQYALQHHGLKVWTAANGDEAACLYRNHSQEIGIVLLDVRMPPPDGPATLALLQSINPALPFCFMSGDFGGYAPEALEQLGAVEVFSKPFHIPRLIEVLRPFTRTTRP